MLRIIQFPGIAVPAMLFLFCRAVPAPAETDSTKHEVPMDHPRLLGSLERLQRLAGQRAGAYERVVKALRRRERGI